MIWHESFLTLFPVSIDLRAKEEAARQAEEVARDQADAGTPSREEAGKFDLLIDRKLSKVSFCDENLLFLQLKNYPQNFHFSYTLRTKQN